MKKIIFVSKTCKLNAKSRSKIASVNAPLKTYFRGQKTVCLVFSLAAVAVREWAWPPDTTSGRSGNGTRRRIRFTADPSFRFRETSSSAAAAQTVRSETEHRRSKKREKFIGWYTCSFADWATRRGENPFLRLPGKWSWNLFSGPWLSFRRHWP